MARIKPFKGVRPPKEYVRDIASKPYDVLSSQEAYKEAEGNEKSLYRIIKPEIDFPVVQDEYAPQVYDRAGENFNKFQQNGWLIQDPEEYYYVYAQTMNKRTQYGLVVCTHAEDYLSGVIKKHELTRKDKEEDRVKHLRVTNANLEPVFYAYQDVDEIDDIIDEIVEGTPEYDFVSDDEIAHKLWIVRDRNDINKLTKLFADIPYLYVADGHHRSASAARIAQEKAKENPHHTGDEEYNYFMAVCFPASQLHVMEYNRIIKDLNTHSVAEILAALKKNFLVDMKGHQLIAPLRPHEFSIYLEGRCYYLIARAHVVNDQDPIDTLDVSISSKYILKEIFGIEDLRTDKRIGFVGGIRGLEALKTMVDNGEAKLALALYPSNIKQVMNVANSGKIMPPKATWFEPKLRSGLVIHKLD